MKATYWIHSNHKQLVGALVAKYSVEKNTKNKDKFDVKIVELASHPALSRRHGQPFLREGVWPKWNNEDLQSFTPLRYLPPELMGFEGRCMIVDPDVFALADVWDLFSRDMKGKAILARRIIPDKKRRPYWATSVMLCDNTRLRHWNWTASLDKMFGGKLDYRDWISLDTEDPETIGELEEEWNSYDRLEPNTKLLHNTGRTTQPWKAGLPIDFLPKKPQAEPPKVMGVIPRPKYDEWKAKLSGQVYAPQGFYVEHPDPNQIRFFFQLLGECMDLDIVTERMLRSEMRRNHVRHDALELVARYRDAKAA
jgi:hypothetical protein